MSSQTLSTENLLLALGLKDLPSSPGIRAKMIFILSQTGRTLRLLLTDKSKDKFIDMLHKDFEMTSASSTPLLSMLTDDVKSMPFETESELPDCLKQQKFEEPKENPKRDLNEFFKLLQEKSRKLNENGENESNTAVDSEQTKKSKAKKEKKSYKSDKSENENSDSDSDSDSDSESDSDSDEEKDSSSSSSSDSDDDSSSGSSSSDDSSSDSKTKKSGKVKKMKPMKKPACGFAPGHSSYVVIKKNLATWPGTLGCMALVDKAMKKGIWHVEFQIKGAIGMGWTPLIGLCSYPWSLGVDSCFGDSSSVAYYTEGYIQAPVDSYRGNVPWSSVNQMGMEVDTKKKTLLFFVDGKRQPVYFTNIPVPCQFGIGIGDTGATAKIIVMKQMKRSSFKKDKADRPVMWT